MAQAQYAGLAEHRASHAGFTATVNDLRQKFGGGQQGLGADVLQILKDWLVQHIQREDKRSLAGLAHSTRGGVAAGNGNGRSKPTAASNPDAMRTSSPRRSSVTGGHPLR